MRGTLFLGIRSLLFSETLQLVRACRCEKNVPSAFLKIFTVLAILAKNWLKLAIWMDVCNSLFKGWKSLKNVKVGVFESVLRWLGEKMTENPGKNLKLGLFETDFKPVPFVFRQTTCKYSESWRPVENVKNVYVAVLRRFPVYRSQNISKMHISDQPCNKNCPA